MGTLDFLNESYWDNGQRPDFLLNFGHIIFRLINGTVRKGSRDWSVLECQSVDTNYSSNMNNRVRISGKLRSTTFSDDINIGGAENDISATHYERRNKKSKSKNSKFCNIL